MTNLRILKKRDGSQVVQFHKETGKPHDPYTCESWHDLPIVDEEGSLLKSQAKPVSEEPKPERSLAQVLYESFVPVEVISWNNLHIDVQDKYKYASQAAEQYFLSKGWRRP